MRTFPLKLLIALCTLVGAASAQAMTTLKQVQVSGGSQIDLLFDGKVSKGQIRTEFFNDVIQLSVMDAAVYPAKISSVNGGRLVKIFAYQYAPKLVRCRLTVKGKAEDFKDRLQLVTNGKLLTVRIADSAEPAGAPAKAGAEDAAEGRNAQFAGGGSSERAKDREGAESRKAHAEEASLLEHVLKSAPSKGPSDAVSTAGSAAAPERVERRERDREREREHEKSRVSRESASTASEESTPLLSGRNHPLGGGRPLPSPWGVLGKLLAVLTLFCAMAAVIKKFVRPQQGNRALAARLGSGDLLSQPAARAAKTKPAAGGLLASLGGSLGDLARSAGANLSRKGRMVEVISNHYLGPKKSIAIVRIAERILVLGVTNESINLITELDESEAGDLDLQSLGLGQGGASRSEAAAKSAAAAYMAGSLSPEPSSREPSLSPSSRDRAMATPFSDILSAEASRPQATVAAPRAALSRPATTVSSPSSVRSQIKSRLEGLKQL